MRLSLVLILEGEIGGRLLVDLALEQVLFLLQREVLFLEVVHPIYGRIVTVVNHVHALLGAVGETGGCFGLRPIGEGGSFLLLLAAQDAGKVSVVLGASLLERRLPRLGYGLDLVVDEVTDSREVSVV